MIKVINLCGIQYKVDDQGNIYRRQGEGFLKQQVNNDGYSVVVIRPSKQKFKEYKVHRIIWEAFNGAIPDGFEIDHINDDRADNKLTNLQLLIHAENVEKAWAKVWTLIDPEGNSIKVYNLSKFCRENNLDQGTMMKVMSGQRNHHKGWTK
jgi:hypothetical protein